MDASLLFAEAVNRYLGDLSIRKPSPHTTAAYRADLTGIARRAAAELQTDLRDLTVAQLDKSTLRAAFTSWAADHAAASIRRSWSVWRGFSCAIFSAANLRSSS